MIDYPRPSLRIDFGPEKRLGPGKIMLLEALGKTGSISAAARDLNMSYKRAWDLVDELNGLLGTPLVRSAKGGSGGGGAVLTDAGLALLSAYREIENELTVMVSQKIEALGGKRRAR